MNQENTELGAALAVAVLREKESRRTVRQQQQWKERAALGALNMLKASSPVFGEDSEDWAELMIRRDRILARAEQRSIVNKLRTRTGNHRLPAWDDVDGVDHAFVGGQSLCRLANTPTPHKGTEVEQPHVDDPLHERTCPLCAGIALVGGVLRGQAGRRAALRGLYLIPVGAQPRWFLAGEEVKLKGVPHPLLVVDAPRFRVEFSDHLDVRAWWPDYQSPTRVRIEDIMGFVKVSPGQSPGGS